jgi:serine/threonine-protein kinase
MAAAIAAVPAIGAGVDAATQLLTSAAGTSAATKLLPATTPTPLVPAADDGEKKKRSPWTWPLIALIILLILVLAGVLYAVFGNRAEAPTKTPAGPAVSSQTHTPDPTPTTVNVDALNLLGMKCADASQLLTSNGLVPKTAKGSPATSADKVDTVASVDPSANVDKGETVTLTCYIAQTDLPAPATPAINGTGDGGQVIAGDTAQIVWDSFQCPAGTGNLSSYIVTVQNGTFVSGGQSTRKADASTTSADVNVANAAGSNLTASVQAICGDRESPASDRISQPIMPQPEPSDSPTPSTDPQAGPSPTPSN